MNALRPIGMRHTETTHQNNVEQITMDLKRNRQGEYHRPRIR